ncbi:DUF4347 domain-containing protein [Noviherbaspirillum sp. Root189]|uniref:DUF4347 domain-containing protein n=1 Tax=Noviherbaspirillum sp. Root189 TaxID=1736487 RepID=UPI000709D99D|nr:DUF4347 domain-containing protein [Noviherbaspirillum sp. Root189]KRB75761.1 hypothetical protein ASE07_26495 [Noviherbaspirillum sp. Root189]
MAADLVSSTASDTGKVIAFIDTSVADYQTLKQNIKPGVEVVLIDDVHDGFAQIAAALRGRSDIEAVHLFSHGGPGHLQVSTANLTLASMSDYSAELAVIRGAMADQGDFLIYGCDVAQGDTGASFVHALADAVGADVTASTNPTGNALLGGDWVLETQTGAIGAQMVLLSAGQARFSGLLASSANFDSAGSVFANGITLSVSGWTFTMGAAADYAVADLTEYGLPINNDSPADRAVVLNLQGMSNVSQFTMKASDNSNFKLQSMQVGYLLGGSSNVTITGYRNGSPVGTGEALNLSSSSSTGNINYTLGSNDGNAQAGTLTFNSGFDNVDEIRFVFTGLTELELDDITVTAPVLPDTTAPTVIGVTSSTANGSYKVGDVIAVQVNFSEAVTVTGTPQLTLETGTTDRVVNYSSGSGTSTLTFNYTVQAGDTSADLNYISTSGLTINGGTIRDAAGNNATLTLATPGAAGSLGANKNIVVDTAAPTISGVTSSTANGSYKVGDVIAVQVNFSEAVTVTGPPQLTLETGTTDRVINYSSGSGTSTLTFNYTVQAGDTSADLDYIGTSALALNGGTIKDAAGNNATLTLPAPSAANSLGANKAIIVDGVAPVVSSVSVPTNATYKTGETLDFTVTFSEAVAVNGTPRLALDIGGTTKYATYLSGTGTSSVVFRYTVESGLTDTNGISLNGAVDLNGSTLRDGAGNNASLSLNGVGSTAAVLINSVGPAITGVGVPSNGTFIAGQTLEFTVNFGEIVTVDTTGGIPQLALTIGNTTKYATYQSGSGSAALKFTYTVESNLIDGNGITISTLAANGGTLKGGNGENATLTLNSVGSTAGVLVDSVAPSVSSVSVPANGVYKAGDNLDFTVSFSEAITVNTSGGVPEIGLTIGSTAVSATYVGGSGTSILTFRHTVSAGSLDADGIGVGSSIVLNGATLKDSATNNAVLTLNNVGATTNVVVDAVAPTVTSVSVPANGTYITGQSLDFTVNFSEAVTISSGTPSIAVTLDNGGTVQATYASGSGTSALVFRYTIATGTADVDGIALAGALTSNGAAIKDAAGNSATLTLNNVGTTTGVLVDGISPSVTLINRVGNTPTGAGSVDYTVTFGENVSGVDVTDFTLNNTGTANGSVTGVTAVNGSTYTVTVSGLTGDGNIRLDLKSTGTGITDAAGNAVSGGYTSGQSYTLDHTGPAVTSVSVPANGTYKAGQTLDFTVNFNEAVVVNTVAGTPSITLDVGGISVNATYVSGTGTNALTFRYTIASGSMDSDGIEVIGASISLNGATLKDSSSNDASLVLNSKGSAVGVLVDTQAPYVTGNITVPTNATYIAGQTLDFTVTFNENVTIAGTDSALQLTIGNVVRNATYVAKNTNSVTYRYTVQPSDGDIDGIAVGTISLGTSTITDSAGNSANVVLTSHVPSTTGILVDAASPVFTSATVNGATLVMTYSEATTLDAVNIPAAGAFAVIVGGTAATVNSVAVNAANKTVTLTLASAVSNGQVVTVAYTDPSGGNDTNAIQDAIGNDAATLAATNVTNNTPVPSSDGGGVPTPTSGTIDGVVVQIGQVINSDGSTSTKITIPVVEPTRNEQIGNNTVADIPLVTTTGGGSLLTAQVPTGIGLTVTGNGTPKDAGSSVTDLIREIKAHTDADSHDQDALTSGGSGFLTALPTDAALLVQTIMPTVANNSAAPTQPLVITGTTPSANSTQTALVIDSRALPSGTEIQLQNVEFAAIIGAVKVTGGNGSQHVWGDSASQTIFLGADDDILHGGAGDDTVGSAGGNDQIFGDEGNDLVFGGEGNDMIDGGTGTDTVRLVGSGRADYSLRVENGKVTMTHRNGGVDGTDTVANVEKLLFTGAEPDMTARGTITRMYDALFDRAPDQQGLDGWVKIGSTGMSMHDIANNFIASTESKALFDGASNGQFIDSLYQKALGRTAAEAERSTWIGILDQGRADRADVLYAFANSAEKLSLDKANGVTLDFNRTDVATLVRLYDTLFDRKADKAGLNYWIAASENGMAMSDIANRFIQIAEALPQFGGMNNTQFAAYLYKTGLGRQGSNAEIAAWAGQLDNGVISRGDALLGFAESVEKIGLIGVISTSIETI